MIRWRNLQIFKPKKSGFYFWKKGDIGGWSYYDKETESFDFDSLIPDSAQKKDTLWLEENVRL